MWAAFVAFTFASAPSLTAQANAAGEWRVTFVVPTGTRSVNMVINQQRASLTGTVINEDGEFPLKGRVADDQVTVVWSVPEAGKLMELTMKGKLSGDMITGTAKIGDVGEGPLTAPLGAGGTDALTDRSGDPRSPSRFAKRMPAPMNVPPISAAQAATKTDPTPRAPATKIRPREMKKTRGTPTAVPRTRILPISAASGSE